MLGVLEGMIANAAALFITPSHARLAEDDI